MHRITLFQRAAWTEKALKFINKMIKSKSFMRMAPCLYEATYKAVSTSSTVTLHQPHRHPNLLSLQDILNLLTSGIDVLLMLAKTHYFVWPSMTLSQEWISAQMIHLGHAMDVLRENTLKYLSRSRLKIEQTTCWAGCIWTSKAPLKALLLAFNTHWQ